MNQEFRLEISPMQAPYKVANTLCTPESLRNMQPPLQDVHLSAATLISFFPAQKQRRHRTSVIVFLVSVSSCWSQKPAVFFCVFCFLRKRSLNCYFRDICICKSNPPYWLILSPFSSIHCVFIRANNGSSPRIAMGDQLFPSSSSCGLRILSIENTVGVFFCYRTHSEGHHSACCKRELTFR